MVKEVGKLMPRLEVFSLENCYMPQQEQDSLLDLMLNSKSAPKHLHTFHWSHAGDVGATMVSRLLQQQQQQTNGSSLKVLRIGELTNKGAIFLADTMSKNTTLHVLDLLQSTITKAGLDAFGRAVQTNSTLRELLVFNSSRLEYLSYSGGFEDGFADGFVAGLEKNDTLIKVIDSGSFDSGRVGGLVMQKRMAASLEYIDFLLLCNRNQNSELRDTHIQLRRDEKSTRCTPSRGPTTNIAMVEMATGSACNKCNATNIPEKQRLQCSQRLHNVCKQCVEACFELKLGESHMACPVAGCTSHPWNVDADLYGFVSSFHYKMHCKEAQQINSLQEIKELLRDLNPDR